MSGERVGGSGGKIRHIEIEWGPTLDSDTCTGCGTCIDWCKHDVYRWSEDGVKVEVETKTNCVAGCSHCATLCEAQALSFPTVEEIKRMRRGG